MKASAPIFYECVAKRLQVGYFLGEYPFIASTSFFMSFWLVQNLIRIYVTSERLALILHKFAANASTQDISLSDSGQARMTKNKKREIKKN